MDLLSSCESEFLTRDLYTVFSLQKHASIEDGKINASQRCLKVPTKNLIYFSEEKIS